MNKDAVVVIDPGHGGNDPGAVNGNVKEKDFNLQSSLYIYNRLRELGIPTVITRDSDTSLPKDARIRRIKEISQDSPNVILLSNHINSGGGDVSNCEGLNLKKYVL